ncbi:MAG: BCCT family transporter [Thiomicrospira sp.]|uniref:BCCT family transporter n=1 Tax=Thiomicrospira sp. TaxID=935 RepID=UPI0019F83FE4|nr:BCCT family transporter [Thiomicrospira sp.]MBE0494234.1 BCCT family transporter [Thiomicrospira sp.]
MYNQARTGLLKGMNPLLTISSFVMIGLALVLVGFYTQQSADAIYGLRTFLNPFLEWYYVALVAFLLFFMIWLGVGRFKNVRLGNDDEQPEFSFFSWISMLFAAGTGIGILFWSVAQPIMQFQLNPFMDQGMTPEAAVIAMRLSFFHWGINGWAIFSFVALTMAYFAFRHNLPLTVRSALYPLLGERVRGPIGDMIDLLAVFATVFGIATTLGLGIQQMNAGLHHVFGLTDSLQLQLTVIAVIMGIATFSVLSGVNRGVRLLSELNFWLSLLAVSFMLLWGPTQYLIGLMLEATGDYIQNIIRMTFHTNVTHGSNWQADWTVFFWGWWIAWSPFVGMFIARISRGRTFREFVAGVLLVPTGITIIWIGLFGGTALYQELFGQGGVIAAVDENVATALFVMISGMELGVLTPWVSSLLLLLIGTYLITSANAGTLVINTILSGGDINPPVIHRFMWGVFLALLTAVLLIAGGLAILQAAVIAAAMPFSLIILAMIASLLQALEQEKFAARTGGRHVPPAEPWIVNETTENEVPLAGMVKAAHERLGTRSESDEVVQDEIKRP